MSLSIIWCSRGELPFFIVHLHVLDFQYPTGETCRGRSQRRGRFQWKGQHIRLKADTISLALFLGTGNATPDLPTIMMERLYTSPTYGMWYPIDEKSLSSNLPPMVVFPETSEFYTTWQKDLESKGVKVSLLLRNIAIPTPSSSLSVFAHLSGGSKHPLHLHSRNCASPNHTDCQRRFTTACTFTLLPPAPFTLHFILYLPNPYNITTQILSSSHISISFTLCLSQSQFDPFHPVWQYLTPPDPTKHRINPNSHPNTPSQS